MINRTANAYIHPPIKSGDYVMLVFGERSIDKVLLSGSEVDPDDLRKHSLNDAIAIPFNPIKFPNVPVAIVTHISSPNSSIPYVKRYCCCVLSGFYGTGPGSGHADQR